GIRQEAREPSPELVAREYPAQEVGLGEDRREEVVARGLVAHRSRDIAAEERARPLRRERREGIVARGPRPIEREPQGERGLMVTADAHRPGEALEPRPQPLRRERLERRERRAPARGIGVAPLAQLGRELEQPGEAVGALERLAALGAHVLDLAREI